MNKQINLRLSQKMLTSAQKYARNYGFSTVQEFIKETVREKLFEESLTKKEISLIKKIIKVSKEKNLLVSEEELFKALRK
tara:strand:+ start:327 stop:566 length:240 start_codon:yes stop_codon:yes gene_type:complete